MMNTPGRLLLCTVLPAILSYATTAQAQGASGTSDESRFLSDYSKLESGKDSSFDELYASQAAVSSGPRYTAVMIDQAEIFLHADSKYKGIKPDDMKAIADAFRERVIDELKSGYTIVDKPGKNVLYVRFAIGDLMLQKKKRPILAYTPVGAVAYGIKKLASEVTSKLDVTNIKIEGEVLDSMTLEQLGAATMRRGKVSSAVGEQSVTWDHLDDLFTVAGKRLRCRLDNAPLPEAQRKQCEAIAVSVDAGEEEIVANSACVRRAIARSSVRVGMQRLFACTRESP